MTRGETPTGRQTWRNDVCEFVKTRAWSLRSTAVEQLMNPLQVMVQRVQIFRR